MESDEPSLLFDPRSSGHLLGGQPQELVKSEHCPKVRAALRLLMAKERAVSRSNFSDPIVESSTATVKNSRTISSSCHSGNTSFSLEMSSCAKWVDTEDEGDSGPAVWEMTVHSEELDEGEGDDSEGTREVVGDDGVTPAVANSSTAAAGEAAPEASVVRRTCRPIPSVPAFKMVQSVPESEPAAGRRLSRLYRHYLGNHPKLRDQIHEIGGRTLVCHCMVDEACHRDILIDLFKRHASGFSCSGRSAQRCESENGRYVAPRGW